MSTWCRTRTMTRAGACIAGSCAPVAVQVARLQFFILLPSKRVYLKHNPTVDERRVLRERCTTGLPHFERKQKKPTLTTVWSILRGCHQRSRMACRQITVDQYFFRNVYYILDTVIPRLLEDPNRKFIYVEVGFFAVGPRPNGCLSASFAASPADSRARATLLCVALR